MEIVGLKIKGTGSFSSTGLEIVDGTMTRTEVVQMTECGRRFLSFYYYYYIMSNLTLRISFFKRCEFYHRTTCKILP